MAYRCQSKGKILYADRTCKNCEGFPIDPEKPLCYAEGETAFKLWIHNCSEAVWQEGILKNKKQAVANKAIDNSVFAIIPEIKGAKLKILYIMEGDIYRFSSLESPDLYFQSRSADWTLDDMGLKKTMIQEEMDAARERFKIEKIA